MNKRVLMDITNLKSPEAKSLRMFYAPNETNMATGFALIFGPEGSIYYNLPIFLEITFPTDYPFTSPKVKFLTSDGKTRFHPNLYVEGKVCLSILGTWAGPSWTSVMTLRTVLLSIMGLLDNDPLLHEPGYSSYKGKPLTKDYSECVEHASLRYIVHTIHTYSTGGVICETFSSFIDEWKEMLPEIYKSTVQRLRVLSVAPQKTWSVLPYNMGGSSSQYPMLLEKLTASGKSLGLKID